MLVTPISRGYARWHLRVEARLRPACESDGRFARAGRDIATQAAGRMPFRSRADIAPYFLKIFIASLNRKKVRKEAIH
jgi:hypothetical protein